MDFLRLASRKKILRTRMYGDEEFTRFELEILHTPIIQRLYNLKQLGFTDRVYPDAVHARFNHILGATGVVDRMVERLQTWLSKNSGAKFAYAQALDEDKEIVITGKGLGELLTKRVPALRLMALLHDLTHAAYGHTLEDEVNVFDEKHDHPHRQAKFFNALVAQLLYLWCAELRLHDFEAAILAELSTLKLSSGFQTEKKWAEELGAFLEESERVELAKQLRDLELAFRLLLHLDFMHQREPQKTDVEAELLVSAVAAEIDSSVKSREFVLHRDMFMVDLVGNTICADLLDYARRDAENAGLRIQFDDRFLRYLCVASVKGELSPTRKACIRTAIQIFTDKMRHDVLSEMSGILKARYLINERVLFHPTKCAAGAMLGTAVQFLDLRDLPEWMQVLGDQELLGTLMGTSRNLELLGSKLKEQIGMPKPKQLKETIASLWSIDPNMAGLLKRILECMLPGSTEEKSLSAQNIESFVDRAHAAQNVLWRIASRRFPRLAYRLRNASQTGGASDKTIAETYSKSLERYELERKVERICNLPMGSVFIHCPRRKTSLKVAEVLVVGSDLGKAAQLHKLTDVSPDGLEPYEREIRAIQEMYFSIWQFHAYLDVTFWDRQPIVQWVLERELGFLNDKLLSEELAHDPTGPFHILAGPLRDDIPPKLLEQVIARVHAEEPARMRGGQGETTKQILKSIIKEVLAAEGNSTDEQPGLPGLEK